MNGPTEPESAGVQAKFETPKQEDVRDEENVAPGPTAVVPEPPSKTEPAGMAAAAGHPSYWAAIPRQVTALLRKNFILAGRNKTATFLRIFASFFFILITFLVNEGIKSRYAIDPFYKDVKTPASTAITGIPACVPQVGSDTCTTFSYTPAPRDGFVPDADYATLDEFKAGIAVDGTSICERTWNRATAAYVDITCAAADCDSVGGACAACCAAYRTHKVVRGMMALNGTSADGVNYPILAANVMGFINETQLDTYILDNPGNIPGGVLFNSVSDNKTSFVVQHNSTVQNVRNQYEDKFSTFTLPLQVAAHKAIIRRLIAKDDNIPIDIDTSEFAHPAYDVATYEGVIAPLLIFGYAMFPFVIQMGEVVADKEMKFRQALAAMGLHDLSYWLSWHIYQTAMAFVSGFFLYAFGCIFQFKLFLKNDFGVLFLTFWLFMQAMVGLGFFVGAFLRRAGSAVSIGFFLCLVGFILFFMIGLFGFPYGSYRGTPPFSYVTDIRTGNLTLTNSTGDRAAEPILAAFPPSIFIKNVNDLGALSAGDLDLGLRFADAESYCTLDKSCNPDYSIGRSWGVYIILYMIYSTLGLYLDNVLPDAFGVRKAPWYFLLPAYWGFSETFTNETAEQIEQSTDEDVIEEEKLVQTRINAPMGGNSAIEIRGLQQRFSRGGKPFYAVKNPWYAVDRRQLFALLGPNGAGKSTTINMLTGWLPPTSGNALVHGHTIADPSGMAKVRSLMGVCPQFDILWDNLSAKQHLELFGAIKGINPSNVAAEADRRIEEVRLTESANQVSGAFSGGMKRRLSVAVALIGNPEVVYLDEPTTGMDPINRRHVWDVIEAAKQDRCVVLTTHSMEEADILGDRIGIMAKGRLRCLGNSVRLKSRFGAGYKVSVSVGDNTKPDDPNAVKVKEMFSSELGADLTEETKTYMHFNLPSNVTSDETRMSNFFQKLDDSASELNISDVQLQMSTLEDVFLKIAKDCEADEAKLLNKTTPVTLKNGEVVSVLMGSEEVLTSPQGINFSVIWGSDENGNLIVNDTKEVEMEDVTALVTAPEGTSTGALISVNVHGQDFQVSIPEGVTAGGQFNVTVKVAKKGRVAGTVTSEAQNVVFTKEDVDQRVNNLQTSFAGQSGALFRKNLTFQSKRKCINCCLIAVPVFFLVLILMLQFLIETLFLSRNIIRCPYCGPEGDVFGLDYCNKENCLDYFFPLDQADVFNEEFGVDVRATCKNVSQTCTGEGSSDCFVPQFAAGSQYPWCPFPIAPTFPSFLHHPPTKKQGGFLSETPVLYTGKKDFADKVATNMYATSDSHVGLKMEGAAAAMRSYMWTLLGAIPFLGCATDDGTGTQMTQAQEAAVCKFMQHGQQNTSLETCCIDISDATNPRTAQIFLAPAGQFAGTFRSGKNVWYNSSTQTDAAYDANITTCTAPNLVLNQTRGACNRAWYFEVVAAGGKVASGFGKASTLGIVSLLGQPKEFTDLLSAAYNAQEAGGSKFESFRCVNPAYTPELSTKLGGSDEKTCTNYEEGLNIIAKTTSMSSNIMPVPEPNKNIPECLADGDCEFKSADGPGGEGFVAPGTTYADYGGRWAQSCDYYTKGFTQDINKIAENPATFLTQITAYLAKVPCMCRWQVASKSLLSALALPTGSFAAFLLQLPKLYNCPMTMVNGKETYDCTPTAQPYILHPFSVPNMVWATPNWAPRSGLAATEQALNSPGNRHWWTKERVFDQEVEAKKEEEKMSKLDYTCEGDQNCWRDLGRGRGALSFVAQDCSALSAGSCWIQRLSNFTGFEMGCITAKPKKLATTQDMFDKTYSGFYDKYGGTGSQNQEEFINVFDMRDTGSRNLNVTIGFNDSTVLSSGIGGQGPPPCFLRLNKPISAVFESFARSMKGAGPEDYVSSMMGLKEMPKLASKLSLDLGGALGPFFFSIAMFLLFPAVTTAMVYEKEMRLRVMMRMMGLGTTAYWLINYIFWFFMYFFFTFIFVLLGSVLQLPSGYTIGIFTRQDYSIHFIFFFLFINNTVSFAFLLSTIIKASRTASISSVLFVIIMSLIGYLAWDGGNFFNSDTVSNDFKNFITLFPVWNLYRGLSEYREYAFQAALMGTQGLTWPDLASDSRNGMDETLIALALEWPIFLLLALYLDQIIDSGVGVPKHPLFIFGVKHKHDDVLAGDAEAAGGGTEFEDVKREEQRVAAKAAAGEQLDAVTIEKIGKVFPAYQGNPPKVAVKTLTMGVPHGECFGMLGPNGAGKTTTINMLVGFMSPSSGTAVVEGFDIRTDMDRIYTIMGVCPQHDILWETLTARQHMLFYGRLKNLKGDALKAAIIKGLKQVNLLHVIDENAGTFSGGMKRRLSVAVSMIGDPLCAYLDEPSTGLDPASRRTLWECIKEAKQKSAIFLTTHSMEEAEGLCDRLGIFVDGQLRCIGNPKELTSRFGGFYILTITSEPGMEEKVHDVVHKMSKSVRDTYKLSGTQKFEIPTNEITLAKVFEEMRKVKEELRIKDWGISNTTLEEAFIKISRGAVGT